MSNDKVALTRILVGDTNSTEILTDDDYTTILAGSADNPRAAAANALRSIAINQALLYKKIEVEGLDIDGPALAKVLLEAAKDIEKGLSGGSAVDPLGAAYLTDIGVF